MNKEWIVLPMVFAMMSIYSMEDTPLSSEIKKLINSSEGSIVARIRLRQTKYVEDDIFWEKSWKKAEADKRKAIENICTLYNSNLKAKL